MYFRIRPIFEFNIKLPSAAARRNLEKFRESMNPTEEIQKEKILDELSRINKTGKENSLGMKKLNYVRMFYVLNFCPEDVCGRINEDIADLIILRLKMLKECRECKGLPGNFKLKKGVICPNCFGSGMNYRI